MNNNSPKKTGGLTARINRTEKKGSLSSLKIVRSSAKSAEYVFPKPKLVPAGKYRSKIVDILESVTKNGDEAIDIHYDFDDGVHRYRIKMRYPVESSHFETLCDALINAGIPENSSIKNAVNVEEAEGVEGIGGKAAVERIVGVRANENVTIREVADYQGVIKLTSRV